ncbi:NOM1 [Mytilus coruscus]|uniref:NOM1 n=1 Tax=Mytilus coruscus TaxID=42192 RepID=A0A6J8AHR0_MYTCO|nr:NOM1 [Mytilus coruscus]
MDVNQGRSRGVSFPSYVEYKSAKNEFRNRQRFAYSAYMDNTYREIDEAAECDVRLLISRQKSRKTNQISELLHHNRLCKSSEDISNAFADFYADVYTPTVNAKFDSDFRAYVTEFVDRTLESCATNNGLLPGGEIHMYEIETAIRNLKLQKVPGYDKLQNEHVRYSGSKLHTVILRIFNAVIRFGRIPLI